MVRGACAVRVKAKKILQIWKQRLRSIAESCARPMLHARSLGFVHPVSGEEINFAVDPPPDFVDVFTKLSKY